MIKVLISLTIIILLWSNAWASNDYRMQTLKDGNFLVHVISDNGWGDEKYRQYLNCVDNQEHLFINITPENYKDIVGLPKDWKPITHWSGSMCIKCRLIHISCCGNDSVKYILKKELKK